MRKATVFTIIFVLLTLTLTHGVNAANCIVVNDCAHDVRVAYATWMEADGKYPEGYRVTGWFYIKPGKKRTFSAKYDIYVRVEGVGKQDQFHTFKPPGAAEEDSYQFSVCSTEKSFIAVETDDRTVIYNSVQRRLLSEASGFYRFAQDATFKVKEVGYALRRRESREEDARIAAANASTYSCTAEATFPPTPAPTSQSYAEKQYGNDGKGQAVTDKRVVDIEKYAVTRKKGPWMRQQTVSPLDDMVESPVILTVKFLNRRSEFFSEKKAKKIEEIASIWSDYGNIEFKFVKSDPVDFSIRLEPRIATDEDGHPLKDENNEPVRVSKYSSYIGTDAKGEVMNLCFTDWENTNDDRKRRVILHEFGHALGFHHEHKNIHLDIRYNRPDVLEFYKKKEGWDPETVETNVFGALDSSKWHFTEFDPHSIMLYTIQQFQTFNNKKYKLTHNPIHFTYNTNLSAMDIAAIKRIYPGRDNPSKRTKSGNGKKYKRYHYRVVGNDVDLLDGRRAAAVLDLFKSKREDSYWRDWEKTFELPRGDIQLIRNVTTRADQGYVKKLSLVELNKAVVIGRIEDGKWDKGTVEGYLEVVYIPE